MSPEETNNPLERCNPAKMRDRLSIVDSMKKAGITFVPIPVMGEEDKGKMMLLLYSRLNALEKLAPAAGKEYETEVGKNHE